MAKTSKSKIKDKKQKLRDLQERMSKYEDEFSQLNFEAEIERFEQLKCLRCKGTLDLDADQIREFMVKGVTSRKIECPHCQFVGRVISKYQEDPEVGTAEIIQEEVGYSYNVKPVSRLNREEAFKRLDREVDAINSKMSKRHPEVQLIFKILDFLVEDVYKVKEEPEDGKNGG